MNENQKTQGEDTSYKAFGNLLAKYYDNVRETTQPAHAGIDMRKARHCLQLSLVELSKKTNVPKEILMAIESGVITINRVDIEDLEALDSVFYPTLDLLNIAEQYPPQQTEGGWRMIERTRKKAIQELQNKRRAKNDPKPAPSPISRPNHHHNGQSNRRKHDTGQLSMP